ncbi:MULTISPECIES: ribonuclease P protein component [unclassified Lentimicrobium]|uniref:ribonuclease P protein component n=1 Tax=unclassified Lentimicrobium TaxID=2677434 RepID=UPI001556403A|nr:MULTISPECIES: ribonuclease P protein component [unclassified Lentimicrobium]NPD46666.1 ribonuclease P protein component [Lentimicrobium sp. S6]NPD85491.1 ribonuclease P protein component [Lentimicrobium sp. L6]
MKNTLPITESLKSKKLIRLLFESGKSEFTYPFKILYKVVDLDENHPAQYMISVSKKRIKTAVGRNHIKRLFRETYRKNKHPLHEILLKEDRKLALVFIFVGKPNIKYQQMEDRIKIAIASLTEKMQKI